MEDLYIIQGTAMNGETVYYNEAMCGVMDSRSFMGNRYVHKADAEAQIEKLNRLSYYKQFDLKVVKR